MQKLLTALSNSGARQSLPLRLGLLLFALICFYSLTQAPTSAKWDKSKLAVIIEGRRLPILEPLLRHFILNTPPEWPFQLWGTAEVLEEVKTSMSTREFVRSGKLDLRLLPVTIKNNHDLSQFMVRPYFWEEMAPAEDIFFFQTDSVICSRSQYTVNDFLGYDWIGANWNWKGWPQNGEGGNGGLSVRKRSALLQVIAHHGNEWEGLNEDMWFIEHLKPRGNMPSYNTSARFALETRPPMPEDEMAAYDFVWEPFGIHLGGDASAICGGKLRADEPTDEARRVLNWCPELRMIVPSGCY